MSGGSFNYLYYDLYDAEVGGQLIEGEDETVCLRADIQRQIDQMIEHLNWLTSDRGLASPTALIKRLTEIRNFNGKEAAYRLLVDEDVWNAVHDIEWAASGDIGEESIRWGHWSPEKKEGP